MARHSCGESDELPSRRSSTTKSLPAPCILVNRIAGAPGCGAAALIASFVTGGNGKGKFGIFIGRRRNRLVLAGAGRHGQRQAGGLLRGRFVFDHLFIDRVPAILVVDQPSVIGRRRHEQVGLVAAGGKGEGGQEDEGGGQAGEVHAGSVAAAAAARNGCGFTAAAPAAATATPQRSP